MREKEQECAKPLLSSFLSTEDNAGTVVDGAIQQECVHSSDTRNNKEDLSDDLKHDYPEHRYTYLQFKKAMMQLGPIISLEEYPLQPEYSCCRRLIIFTFYAGPIWTFFLFGKLYDYYQEDVIVHIFILFFSLVFGLMVVYDVVLFQRGGPISYLDYRIKFLSLIWGNNSNRICAMMLSKADVSERILGKPKQAIDYYQQVIDYLRNRNLNKNDDSHQHGDNSYDDWRLAPFQSALGRACFRAGMYKEAVGPLLECVRLYKEGIRKFETGIIQDIKPPLLHMVKRKLPTCMNYIGFALEELCQYQEAAKYHREAVAYIRGYGEIWGKRIEAAKCFKHLGRALALAGDADAAVEAYRSTVSLYILNYSDSNNDDETLGSVALGGLYIALGDILLDKKKDFEAALKEYQSAESEYRRAGLVDESTKLRELLQKIDETKLHVTV